MLYLAVAIFHMLFCFRFSFFLILFSLFGAERLRLDLYIIIITILILIVLYWILCCSLISFVFPFLSSKDCTMN